MGKGKWVTWGFLILALTLSSQIGSHLVVPAAIKATNPRLCPGVVFRFSEAPPTVKAAVGDIYYVAPYGNDSNPGTEDNPWKTIQYAVDNVNPGDITYVKGGIYNESIQFHQSGQEGSPITLTNYNNEAVTINGGGSPAILDVEGTQYWIIEGFTLDSNAQRTIEFDAWGCDGTCGGTHHWTIRNNTIFGAVSIYGSYNVFESNEVDGSQYEGPEDGVRDFYDVSHHNIYRNNHIHHFKLRGIWTVHRTHDNIIENNYIHHITSPGGLCIDADGAGNVEWRHTIRGNHLHHCGETGIELENTFDSIVENNIIHDIGREGVEVINYGQTIPTGDNKNCEAGGEYDQYGDTDGDNDCEGDITENIIRQNLIYNAGEQGAIVIYHAGGVKVWGNTVYNSQGSGIFLDSGVDFTPEIEIRGNILAENDGAEIFIYDVASLIADDHNLLYHMGEGDAYEINLNYYSLSEYQAMTGQGQGSIQENPQFVGASNYNLRIQESSPAVDAGVDIGLTTDLDGHPRPQGGGYDIGVYEHVFPRFFIYLPILLLNFTAP